VSAASCVLAVAGAAQLHAQLHYLHQAILNAEHGVGAPAPPSTPAYEVLWNDVSAVLDVTAFIILLIWQFRAAKAARALAYPARRSPGWGVGFWFIPVVNLWLPYQAIRDCLPPGHGGRPAVLHMWLLLLAAQAMTFLTLVLALVSRSAGLAPMTVGLLLWALYAVSGAHVLSTIALDHRRAVGDPLT
jgi:uncharacterized protein DUF4328